MSMSYENGIPRSFEIGPKTNRKYLTRSNLKRASSMKLKNKVNDHDSVQNLELPSFTRDYVQGFNISVVDKRQKVRDQLFKEMEI